jgi:O-antigen biosynthesis protein
MTIGIYSPYLDTLGGGERYMLTIASCLSARHRVHLFWHDPHIIEKAQDRLSLNLQNVRVVPSIFSKSIVYRIAAMRTYDAIFYLSDGSIPVSFSKRTIIHFQQPFTHVNGGSLMNRLKLSSSRRIICNSIFTKGFIDREYGVVSDVVYPPVQTELFKHNLPKKKIILSVGRFHPVKKHAVLIDTFIQGARELNGWKLVLAGGLLPQDNEYFNFLNDKKSSAIELLPNIPFSQLQKLYQQASIYWHAAGYAEDEALHPERLEHFGIAPVEAMDALCVPFLYNGGGLREIVTHGRDGFLWKTPEELLSLTMRVIGNNKEIIKIRENAGKRSREFSEAVFCQKISALIQS